MATEVAGAGLPPKDPEMESHPNIRVMRCTLPSPLAIASLPNIPNQLRCRFYHSDKKEGFSDYSAQLSCQTDSCHCCDVHCSIPQEKDVDDSAKVAVVLPDGEEIVCEAVLSDETQQKGIFKKLSFLDRFLYIWIFVVMAVAILVGNYVGNVKKAFQVVELKSVSLPIAIGLWVMMFPVLCKVRYELLGQMFRGGQLGKQLLISVILNWVVGPALMTGLAWATLPDLPNYRTGVILVGIARCIAMVLIWNDLAKGDRQLCAIIVAVNSIMQIVFFTPVALFYIKVISREDIDVSFWTIAKSVLLFLGIPLVAGIITRYLLRALFGKKWYDSKFLPIIGPWALIGLLFTIFVMFSVQAHQIINNIGHVVRVAVPLMCYFAIVFWSTLGACQLLKILYPETVTQSFTAASNNFELAIAIAVGSFGIDSEEALAATIGPLIEVPALLLLVYVTLHCRKWMVR